MAEVEFTLVNLQEVLEQYGEDQTKEILSSFSCQLNPDVEDFIHQKAIAFSRQGIARTHLVVTEYNGVYEIVGYFSLANKIITVSKDKVSRRIRDRLRRFGEYNQATRSYDISAPLIGQIGKNYTNNLNTLITGDRLLEIACDKLRKVQMDIGGGFVYLECEEKAKLMEFYSRNGFVEFDKRKLDRDETNLSGQYLIQMLRYL